MNERPPILRESLAHLCDLLGKAIELAVAEKTAQLKSNDPDMAETLLRRWRVDYAGYTIRPMLDRERLEAATARIDKAWTSCADAFRASVEANTKFVDGLRGGGAIDCAILAEHQREIYGQILTFHLEAAQTVCAMLEIQDAVRLEHVCLPDPCGYPAFTPSAGAAQAEAKAQKTAKNKGR